MRSSARTRPKDRPVKRQARTAPPAGGTPGASAPRGLSKDNRVPLTRERVVDAAHALIERDGLAKFSTRKLGDMLGVEAMSIYHHFRSKQQLLDALVDRAVASMEMPPADLPPLERLRRVCYAFRDMAHRNRRLFPLIALHRMNTPTGVAMIESVLALVHEVEPDPERAARQLRVVGYYVNGAALDETSGYARGPFAAEPVDDAYIARHCPHLAQAARYFKEPEWDATFALGLEALMAGFTK